MIKPPTKEDIAELNKLYGNLRKLKLLRKAKANEMFAPVREATENINSYLKSEFDKDIEKLAAEIIDKRSKLHIKSGWWRAWQLKKVN